MCQRTSVGHEQKSWESSNLRGLPKLRGWRNTAALRFPGRKWGFSGAFWTRWEWDMGKGKIEKYHIVAHMPEVLHFVSNFKGSYQPLIVCGSPQVKVKMPCSSTCKIAVLKACWAKQDSFLFPNRVGSNTQYWVAMKLFCLSNYLIIWTNYPAINTTVISPIPIHHSFLLNV